MRLIKPDDVCEKEAEPEISHSLASLELLLTFVERVMAMLRDWVDWYGESVLYPLAGSIREYFEGANPPVLLDNHRRLWAPRGMTISIEDALIIFACSVAFCVLSPLATKFFYLVGLLVWNVALFNPQQPLASLLKLREGDRLRFREAFWQLCFYAPAWLWSWTILSSSPWFSQPSLLFETPFPHQEMRFVAFSRPDASRPSH